MSNDKHIIIGLQNLGFRCLEPTEVRFLDGAEAAINAEGYRKSLEQPNDTPRQRRALKYYAIISSSGEKEVIDELTLEQRLGLDAFARLPT